MLEWDNSQAKSSFFFRGDREVGCMLVQGCERGYKQIGSATRWQDLKCEAYYRDIYVKVDTSSTGAPKVTIEAPSDVKVEIGLARYVEQCSWGGYGSDSEKEGDVDACSCTEDRTAWTYNNMTKLNSTDTITRNCNQTTCTSEITTKTSKKIGQHYFKIDGEVVYAGDIENDGDLFQTMEMLDGSREDKSVVEYTLRSGKQYKIRSTSSVGFYTRGKCQ